MLNKPRWLSLANREFILGPQFMCPAALEATLLPPPPVHSLAESREVKAQITPGVAFPWSPFQNPALARLVHSGVHQCRT